MNPNWHFRNMWEHTFIFGTFLDSQPDPSYKVIFRQHLYSKIISLRHFNPRVTRCDFKHASCVESNSLFNNAALKLLARIGFEIYAI